MANLTPQELAELQSQQFQANLPPPSGTPTIAPFDPNVTPAAPRPFDPLNPTLNPSLPSPPPPPPFDPLNPTLRPGQPSESAAPPTTAPGVAPAGTSGTASLGHGGGTAPLPPGPHNTQTDTGREATPPPPTADHDETESPEAVLARLRAERDADNAISLRDSDANRAGWLAQVEAILATLRTPTEQAKAYGAALFAYLASYFRELIGHEPWAETAMGKVLRVDRPTKTCRVRIGADDLNPAAVPDQRQVSYGLRPPTVGRTYPVHFPTRATRSGALLAEPDPEHLPWLKVPGSPYVIWLYYQTWSFPDNPGGEMRRMLWPPSDDPLSGELLRTVPGDVHFRASHTGTRSVWTDTYAQIADWGFGDSLGNMPAALEDIVDDDAPTLEHIVLSGVNNVIFSVDPDPDNTVDPPTTLTASSTAPETSINNGASYTMHGLYEGLREIVEFQPEPPASGNNRWHKLSVAVTAINGAGAWVALNDSALGPSGTYIVTFLKRVQSPVLSQIPNVFHDFRPHYLHYDADLLVYTRDPSTEVATFQSMGFAPPGEYFGMSAPIGELTIVQRDDGALLAFTRCRGGAEVEIDAEFEIEGHMVLDQSFLQPQAVFRGEGQLGGFAWTQIGSTWYDGTLGTTLVPAPNGRSPKQITALSHDGQALIATAIGFDPSLGPIEPWFVFSEDAGDSWDFLPISWQPTGDHGTPLTRSYLLVAIPTDDPRAVRGGT